MPSKRKNFGRAPQGSVSYLGTTLVGWTLARSLTFGEFVVARRFDCRRNCILPFLSSKLTPQVAI